MKKMLSSYFRSLLIICAFSLVSNSSRANHILGMDLSYAWVSGSTYQIKLVIYGDCGNSSFSTLPTATPELCIYNGTTYVTHISMTLQAPTAGLFTAPVCARDTDSTTCTSLSYSIPGIKKFTFTANYTTPSTSTDWQFLFNGWLSSSYAGRSTAITNITFGGGVSIIALVDTLNNSTYNNAFNTSPVLTNDPVPYYCIDYPDYYNPEAVPTAGDSISFFLVPGKLAPYPSTSDCTPTGEVVTYTGTAWSGIGLTVPVSATTPIVVDSGTYSFVPSTGEVFFTPNASQRALVVYNIENYNTGSFLGTSQREMVFLCQTCSNTPPTAKITNNTGKGEVVDSIHYKICENDSAFCFNVNPTEADTTKPIFVSAIDIPTGASFTIVNDSTNHPTCTFCWTSNSVAPGVYTFYVTYSDNSCPIAGSNTVPFFVTITSPPSVITGTVTACVGRTTTLTDTITGGIWTSTTTGVATIGSTTGVVTGVAAGTDIITYSIGIGCLRTTTVIINPLPAAITGTTHVCVGLATTLTDGSGGGTWQSGATAVGTIGSVSGRVAGILAGTTIITYTLPTGCLVTTTYVVNPLPTLISGSTSFCTGTSSTLTDGSLGGTWSSSNTAVGTVGLTSGVVYGVSAGTFEITYTLGTSCLTAITVTINPLPTAIFGTPTMCQGGGTTTLADATGGGTWSVNDVTVALIGSSSGVVTGVLPGTTTVTYTLTSTGCWTVSGVTVNPAPSPISGLTSLCVGTSTTLSDVDGGGVWSSSNSTVAPIGSLTGIVTGNSVGLVNIIYTLSTGCDTSVSLTVYPNPGSISGPTTICQGTTATLTDGGGGTWSSSNTSVAAIISTLGLMTGSGAGTATITYTLSTGCIATIGVTVVPDPSAIAGADPVCAGTSLTFTDGVSGGTWNSSNTAVGTIVTATGAFSAITAGTTVITYSLGASCKTTRIETVVTSPAVITGTTTVCVGSSTTLSDGTGGGTWTSGSTAIGTISTTGVVYGASSGTTIITYKIADGCMSMAAVTVNPTPTPITGTPNVCVGSSTTLGDGVVSGLWSGGGTVATVGSTSGMVTGVVTGTTVITYSFGNCRTTTSFTVNPLPGAISGTLSICSGASTTLTDATSGGSWISGNISVATIGSTTGMLSGVIAGTVLITYVLPTGCSATTTVTINSAPAAIGGATSLCSGNSVTLTDATSGGTWLSGNIAVATIGTGTGVLAGVGSGTTIITYTLGGTCNALKTVTVYASPAAPSGPTALCVGASITLSDAVGGGTWVSTNTAVATIGSVTGIVNGVLLGTTIITYTAPGGCYITTTISVSSTPTAILGTDPICMGASYNWSDLVGGGLWTSANMAVATIGSTTGVINGVSLGTAIISYSLGSGCLVLRTATVIASPAAITGTTSICVGQATTLSETGGGTWSSGNVLVGSVGAATGVAGGIGAGTAIITYTIANGCTATTTLNVSPTPTAITGTASLCSGTSTSLGDAVSGGVWTSTNVSVATVGTSGTVNGVAAGTSIISYTLGGACYAVRTVTVFASPSAITGPSALCVGATTDLGDLVGSGTWVSGNTAVGTIGATSGIIYGVALGTTIVTYTAPGNCATTTTITVSPTPTPIVGAVPLCVGASVTLTDGVSGGSWASSITAVATVGSLTGIVTGASAGTSMITYSLGSGCIATVVVTVMMSPSPISGVSALCVGQSATLTDAGGGTWTSSNISVASIGAGTGYMNGAAAGTATITYQISDGCMALKSVTISPLPGVINGTLTVCAGLSTTLTDLTGGGTWTSGTTAVATIGLVTGIATGVVSGTSMITYTLPGGCYITAALTVNPSPAAIGGTLSVCAGTSTTLTDATGGGTWASGNLAVATIVSTTGYTDGLVAGTSIITYTLPAGCKTNAIFVVNPLPDAISGTLSVCTGQTTTLNDLTGGGTWSSEFTGIATVGLVSGAVSGVAQGTTLITYTLPGGCYTTGVMTVNPTPSGILGLTPVCAGSSINISDLSSGGTWWSSNTGTATVGSTTGVLTGVAAGSAIISYILPAGCYVTGVENVLQAPDPITGSSNMCVSTIINYSDLIGGGTWHSSNTGVATITLITGSIDGVAVGTTTITYQLPSGCLVTQTLTVNPTATAILGPLHICYGSCYNLTDAVTGGTWLSTNTGVATIGSSTGIICGVTSGSTIITYSLGAGCEASDTITVAAPPSGITGTFTLCQNTTTNLSDLTLLGTWSSSNPAVAPVGPTTGIVAGVGGGTAIITYTIPDGCVATQEVTVNPIGAITGPSSVCQFSNIVLLDAVTGGTWYSEDLTVADIDATSGTVTGVGSGSAIISYALSTGCSATRAVTVNPVPAGILGIDNVCIGQTTTLTDGTGGGNWISSSTGVASVVSGVVSGVTAGTAIVSYRLPTGCQSTTTVTVNPLPLPILGAANICVGASVTLTDPVTGGSWTATSGVMIGSSSGEVTGVTAGSAIVTYTLGSGCIITKTMVVNPSPSAILGADHLCIGQSTGLSDTYPGGSWSSSNSLVASIGTGTGIVTGVNAGSAIISYSLSTGCNATMPFTVISLPSLISGDSVICVGATSLLTDMTGGGTWASSNTSVATIGSSSGAATGQSSGTVLISYTLGTGCMTISSFIVNPLSPIDGPSMVCAGQTMYVSDTTEGGTWTSSNTLRATAIFAGDTSGLISGISAGPVTISYSLPSGCVATKAVTVNPAPLPVAGDLQACVGQSTTLTDPTFGGTWASDNLTVATVIATSGEVTGMTAGTVAVSYTVGGCPAVATVTVNPLPSPIVGNTGICLSLPSILTDGIFGGTWTSSNASIAPVGYTTGVVIGASLGSATITYTLSTGCFVTTTVTVDPVPGPITGSPNFCVGSTSTLHDGTTGGAWSSSNSSIASVDVSGDVTGVLAGSAIISYSLGTGCLQTKTVTILTLPPSITGSPSVCVGSTDTLADAAIGGTWTSSTIMVATVSGTLPGVTAVTGVAAGTSVVTYSLGAGCTVYSTVSVNPLPLPISGSAKLCVGLTTNLTDFTGGGTWSSSDVAVGTIDESMGVLAGITAGTSVIAYMLPTGCSAFVTATVYPFPGPITGDLTVCLGNTSSLSDSVHGGSWYSTNTAIATVGLATGLVTGDSLSYTDILYVIGPGCSSQATVTVVPIPKAYLVTGGGSYCAGGNGVSIGLDSSDGGTNYLLYRGITATGAFPGTGFALNFGLQTVAGVYTVVAINTTTGCTNVMRGSATVVITPTVVPGVRITSSGRDTVCSGTSVTYVAVPAHGGPTPAYEWNVNGTNVGLGGSYTYIPANGDVVKVTMTSDTTCPLPDTAVSTDTINVQMLQTPSVNFTTLPGDTVCQGISVTFYAVPGYGGSSPAYAWIRDNGAIGSGPVFTYIPSNGDTVYCFMTSNFPCLVVDTASSPKVVMTVDTPIIPTVTIGTNPGTSVDPGGTVTFTANVINGGSDPTYQWFVNSVPIVGATSSTFTKSGFDKNFEDSVSVVVTSSGICPMSTHNWVYIEVSDEGVKNATGGFGAFSVLPNPNKGNFTIKGNLGTTVDEEITIEVTDLLGQSIYQNKIIARGGTMNAQVDLGNNIANGMYMLNLHSGTANQVFHIVVEN